MDITLTVSDGFVIYLEIDENGNTTLVSTRDGVELPPYGETLTFAVVEKSSDPGEDEEDTECGLDLEWSLNNDGVLTITGSGTAITAAPWEKSEVKALVIEAPLASIADNVFDESGELTVVFFTGTKAQWDAISVADGNAPLTSAKVHAEVAVKAFCDGAYLYCAECDAYFDVTGVVVEHSFTNYISNEDATCEADGTKTAQCDNCTEKDTIADPGSKKEHKYTEYKYNDDATIDADGTETAFCDYGCGTTDTRTAEGTKLPEAQKNGWVLEGGKWYYYKNNAKKTGWLQEGSTWYYLNASGEMVTGWMQEGSIWYYFNASGAMVTGTVTIGGKQHKFNASGAWQGEVQNAKTGWAQEGGVWYYYKDGAKATGWQQIGGVWYYFSATGAMKTGWQYIGNVWYYFNASGAMKTGWQYIGNVWYYFNASGAMKTGWLQRGSVWYYFNASGAMVTGTVTIDGKQHKFNASGAWQGEVQNAKTGWAQEGGVWYYYKNGAKATGWQQIGGVWYYFNTNGAMKTGWLLLSGNWYYFNSTGAMATGSVTIGGKVYNFNASGVCLNP